MDALPDLLHTLWLPLTGCLLLLGVGYGWLRMARKKRRPPIDSFIAPSTEQPDPPSIEQTAEPPVEPPVEPSPTQINHYRIEQTLGRGAMGTVYLGRDLRTDQEVALKLFPVATSTAAARDRFLRGATLASRLTHPHIVRIHDQGEEAEWAYVVMERLTGHSLEVYTQATPDHPLLPVPWVILMVAQVAMALDYAHKNQVVHRDIKPANLLLDPATRQVRIMDFGIAQEMIPDRTDDGAAAKTRLVAGTPCYMSPEQLLGQPVDGRSDLFSLGVVFYQLLTGHLPFPAQEMASLLLQISREPPVDLLTVRPTLPACLRVIVGKVLQKEVSKRYQTGRQLTEALLSCVKNQIGSTRKPA